MLHYRSASQLVLQTTVLAALISACGSSQPTTTTANDLDEEIRFADEARVGTPEASDKVSRGETLMAGGEIDEAERLFDEAIAEDSGDARAHINKGLIQEAREDMEGAEASYRAAIGAQADFAEAHNNLGALLRDTGRLPEAITTLETATQHDPRSAEAHSNLALALEDADQHEAAVASWGRAVELASQDGITRVNYGLAQLRTGDREAGVATLREAIPLAQGNVAALVGAGAGLRQAGEFGPATRAFQDAVAAREEGPTASLLTELAMCQLGSGAHPDAERSLRSAIEVDETHPIAHYLLGGLLLSKGETDEGRQLLERSIELDPEGPHVDRARRRLER